MVSPDDRNEKFWVELASSRMVELVEVSSNFDVNDGIEGS